MSTIQSLRTIVGPAVRGEFLGHKLRHFVLGGRNTEADERENIGVDSSRNADHDSLIQVLVKIGHFRCKDADDVSTTGECQIRKEVVNNAAKVAANK